MTIRTAGAIASAGRLDREKTDGRCVLRTGFTLIETLAVVVMLAAASAAAIGVVGPLSAGQRRLAAITATRDALERSRLLAESGGGATLAFGEALTARSARGGDGSPVSIRIALPAGWMAALEEQAGGGESRHDLVFDWDGACPDGVVRLRGPRGAGARLEFLGLTGQVRELERATIQGEER